MSFDFQPRAAQRQRHATRRNRDQPPFGGAFYAEVRDKARPFLRDHDLGEALIQLKKPADACKVYAELEQVYGSTLSSGLRGMMDKGRTKAKCSV